MGKGEWCWSKVEQLMADFSLHVWLVSGNFLRHGGKLSGFHTEFFIWRVGGSGGNWAHIKLKPRVWKCLSLNTQIKLVFQHNYN